MTSHHFGRLRCNQNNYWLVAVVTREEIAVPIPNGYTTAVCCGGVKGGTGVEYATCCSMATKCPLSGNPSGNHRCREHLLSFWLSVIRTPDTSIRPEFGSRQRIQEFQCFQNNRSTCGAQEGSVPKYGNIRATSRTSQVSTASIAFRLQRTSRFGNSMNS